MNQAFYVDYNKYLNTKEVLTEIALEIERDYGKSTPVIFTGHYSTPYSLVEDYYVSYGSWQYRVIAAITDKVDPHLKEKYFAPQGYCFTGEANYPFIQWAFDAFDGTNREMMNFLEMHGHSFPQVTDPEILEQAAAGIVDLYLDSSFIYGSYGDEEELGRPFFSVTMPFLFPDAETAAEVLDSTGGEALNGVLAELGLRGLAYGELGFRYLTADRPVTTPEDLEGLRIRTAGLLELFESYIGCWGVRLYPSSYSDVMTPLSNGTYNGQESTLAEADVAGYQTVQTDVTIFPAFYEPAILTMNSDLYDSLSPDLREAVDRCGREAMADQRLRNREQEAEILERWQEEDGIAVHVLTEEQWGAFQTLTERLYDPEDPDHQDWFADCTPEWVEQFRPS